MRHICNAQRCAYSRFGMGVESSYASHSLVEMWEARSGRDGSIANNNARKESLLVL
jgi:hypothetical protein